MRLFAQILTFVFMLGLAGSAVVVAMTFWSDLEAFTPDEPPRSANPVPETVSQAGMTTAGEHSAG